MTSSLVFPYLFTIKEDGILRSQSVTSSYGGAGNSVSAGGLAYLLDRPRMFLEAYRLKRGGDAKPERLFFDKAKHLSKQRAGAAAGPALTPQLS